MFSNFQTLPFILVSLLTTLKCLIAVEVNRQEGVDWNMYGVDFNTLKYKIIQ